MDKHLEFIQGRWARENTDWTGESRRTLVGQVDTLKTPHRKIDRVLGNP
jgi:hypothetical protein